MTHRIVLAMAVVLLLATAGLVSWSVAQEQVSPDQPAAPNAPAGFASPINGGCYIAGPDTCKIHIDPFVININDAAGARLELFSLYANGNLIYDFRTDVSNPPNYDYWPSLVMEDFAATCGESYVVNMIAKDTSDQNPLNYGQTTEFTCPAGVP